MSVRGLISGNSSLRSPFPMKEFNARKDVLASARLQRMRAAKACAVGRDNRS